MSTVEQHGRSFLDALSSFWPSFFRDVRELKGYYEGVRINLGQLYLDLISAILGTSLKDMPLYSRQYFKLLEVRRDQLSYVEGASPALDRYAYASDSEVLGGVGRIANRVLRPTTTLLPDADYDVKDGFLRLAFDLFAGDDVGFPIRNAEVIYPAKFKTPLAGLTAKIGDTFRMRVLGTGNPITARIGGVATGELFLSETRPEFGQDLSTRTVEYSVVRTPFNAQERSVPLSAHPKTVSPYIGGVGVGTKQVDLTASVNYKGDWAPTFAYDEGDLVNVGTYALYRAKRAHFSGVTFDASQWDAVLGNYLDVRMLPDVVSDNDGMYKVNLIVGPGVVRLERPYTYVPGPVLGLATVVIYEGTYVSSYQPAIDTPRTVLTPGTVKVYARRFFDNAPVKEGEDYRVDYETGRLVVLTSWNPAAPARVDYDWQKLVGTITYAFRGAWTASTAYYVGELVVVGGVTYLCVTPDPGSVSFDATKYVKYSHPFTYDVQRTEPLAALWLVDALVDNDALWANFGYLLDYKKPTSEQYRIFLKGVSQLFLLGPALERFESAMNAMAGYPVVRDDGELLLGYDDGVFVSGSAGAVTDSNVGVGGTLDTATSTFSAPTLGLLDSDVGAAIRVREGLSFTTYTVLDVLSATTARVSPTPPDAVNLQWQYDHLVVNRRFSTTEYVFTDADVGSLLTLPFGTYTVSGIESATSVTLQAEYGFRDATGLAWSLSRTGRQTVTTSRTTYELPLGVVMRAGVVDPSNYGRLTLAAFEPLSDAFQVVDYIEDPTWWHDVTIPQEVLQQTVEAGGRRHVTPTLIEHVYGALDTAVYGDAGLGYGVDDEGEPGIARAGTATWYGGDSVVLSFAPGVPVGRVNDVGRYLTVTTPGFEGHFPVRTVSSDGLTLQMDLFPPPESAGVVPPQVLSVELSPLLYRRTVAFVMMDRYLKYHAIRVRIDPSAQVPSAFVSDVTRLLREAKPAHTFIYFDSLTSFKDTLRIEEDFVVTFGPLYLELLRSAYTPLTYGGAVRYGDAFRYTPASQGISGTPGTYALTFSVPAGDVESNLVKLRFASSVLVNAGARRPVEGTDYTIDVVANTITILPGSSFPVGPNTVNFLVCVRRIRGPADALDATETRLAYGGADPTTIRASGTTSSNPGILDRAVQITLGP